MLSMQTYKLSFVLGVTESGMLENNNVVAIHVDLRTLDRYSVSFIVSIFGI